MTTRDVPPSAPALMVSLRGLGYALETAIADLVDNSISARSTQIDIQFDWNGGDPLISLIDDGVGITPEHTIDALRFGGIGPQRGRERSDLGRFGLGLKTASLSQCRRMTVATKSDSGRTILTWDVDHVVGAGGRWEVLEDEYSGPGDLLASVEARPTGTLILWEKVDFGRAEDTPHLDQFLRDLERLEFHLGMVFWQFLSRRTTRLVIRLNGHRVEAWDPFGSNLPATISLPEQKLRAPGGEVRVRGHVLPHRDRFSKPEDYERMGGPEGWTAQQGFYVYREGRLLVAGGWMGLGRNRTWVRDEPSRLARIRIEIANTSDRDWRIDVRKSIARPPDAIRSELQRIAEDVRRRAREVFVHRGMRGPRGDAAAISRVWSTTGDGLGGRYKVRRDHELVSMVRKRLGRDSDALEALLATIEATVPVERIWLEVTEKGVPEPDSNDAPELLSQARMTLNLFLKAGMTSIEAEETVSRMEPFNRITNLRQHLQQRTNGIRT